MRGRRTRRRPRPVTTFYEVVTKFLSNFNVVTTVTTSTMRNNFPIEKCVTIPGLSFPYVCSEKVVTVVTVVTTLILKGNFCHHLESRW